MVKTLHTLSDLKSGPFGGDTTAEDMWPAPETLDYGGLQQAEDDECGAYGMNSE